jgi:hypothetical protein
MVAILEVTNMDYFEKRMIKLRSHPNLSALYNTLPFHTKRIIEKVLETGVTFPLMEQANQCMHQEFSNNAILQILANGDVRSLKSVTNIALDEIEYLLETVSYENEQ